MLRGAVRSCHGHLPRSAGGFHVASTAICEAGRRSLTDSPIPIEGTCAAPRGGAFRLECAPVVSNHFSGVMARGHPRLGGLPFPTIPRCGTGSGKMRVPTETTSRR